MPDDWEFAHGFDPHAPGDASLDADGDGLTNLQEYLSGTDPHDPQSNLRIESLHVDGNDCQLRFTAIAGKHYWIEHAEAVPSGSWRVLTEISPQPTTGSFTVTNSLTDGPREQFYRLRTP